MPLGAARFGFQSGESFMEASGGTTNTYTEGGKIINHTHSQVQATLL